MTGTELRERREKMLLTQAELAQIIRVATASVEEWERGDSPIPHSVIKLLKDVEDEVLHNPWKR